MAVCHGFQRPKHAGQGIIEYGLILAIMAVVCVVSLLFFGDQLSSLLSLVAVRQMDRERLVIRSGPKFAQRL